MRLCFTGLFLDIQVIITILSAHKGDILILDLQFVQSLLVLSTIGSLPVLI